MSQLSQIQLVTTISETLENQGRVTEAQFLQSAQHFEIDREIFRAAIGFNLENTRDGEVFIDSVAKPPAQNCTLRIEGENSIFTAQYKNDQVLLNQVNLQGIPLRSFRWRCGSNDAHCKSAYEDHSEENEFVLYHLLLTLPLTLVLINAPKLVEIETNRSRQERRAAHRSAKIAVDAWHKVSWKTAAGRQHDQTASETEDTGPKIPLHYRRGHLRTAQEHFDGAFATNLTKTGWGQFIDGCWVGCPSLGIKKSKFEPKFDADGFAKFAALKKQQFETQSDA